MIARLWKGWTTRENADAYERHLREDLLPSLNLRIGGYQGGYVLRQDGSEEVEFVVLNLFDSLADVQAFAGPDYTVAVFEPVARRLLSKVEPIAHHYEVTYPALKRGVRDSWQTLAGVQLGSFQSRKVRYAHER